MTVQQASPSLIFDDQELLVLVSAVDDRFEIFLSQRLQPHRSAIVTDIKGILNRHLGTGVTPDTDAASADEGRKARGPKSECSSSLVASDDVPLSVDEGHVRGDHSAPDHLPRDVAGDEQAVYNWYYHKFSQLQQKTCRLVAKRWISQIHPKKVGGLKAHAVVADRDSAIYVSLQWTAAS
jgi:hypothetical protein